MQHIVILLPESTWLTFEKQNVWEKIGVTYSPPDIDQILCDFHWKREVMVPRRRLLFIDGPITEIRDDQITIPEIFQNFIELNQKIILEKLLEFISSGILLRRIMHA